MTTNARLRAFDAVVRTGSVRAAAQRLFVTESSVSAAVAALAKDVGAVLFERRGRGLRLTDAGRIYADYARTILGLHDEAVAATRGEVNPEEGLVRIAAVPTAAEHVLPELLASFRKKYPRAQVRLDVAARDEVWPILVTHGVDVVFAGRPPNDLDAAIRLVSPNTLVVVGAPELAGDFDPAAVTWLMREIGSGTRATCEALWGAFDATPPQLTLGSNGAVIAGAVAGLGVTLVSRDAVHNLLASEQLMELPVAGTPLSRPWHAVTQHTVSATTELLLDHVVVSSATGSSSAWQPPRGHAPSPRRPPRGGK